jgi:hypothetical protein
MEVSLTSPSPTTSSVEVTGDMDEITMVTVGDITVYDSSTNCEATQAASIAEPGNGQVSTTAASSGGKKSRRDKKKGKDLSDKLFDMDELALSLPSKRDERLTLNEVPTSMKHPDLYSAVAPPVSSCSPIPISVSKTISTINSSDRKRNKDRRRNDSGEDKDHVSGNHSVNQKQVAATKTASSKREGDLKKEKLAEVSKDRRGRI